MGFFSEGELFIIGRIKDLLIVYGRNHSPDDIEATIQEITRGRCVAIGVPDEGIEKLVTIVELKKKGDSDEDALDRLDGVKREITAAISNAHGLGASDVRSGCPWLDSHHHERQSQAGGVCVGCTRRVSSPA